MGKSLKIQGYAKDKSNTSKTRTKFGGQPDWLAIPEWPMSAETGNPMKFIGQIDLSESVYDQYGFKQKMAYIFMTDEETYVDETWVPNGGENAVIIQAGGCDKNLKTENLLKGPTHSEIAYYPIVELAEIPCSSDGDESLYDCADAFPLGFLGGRPIFIQGDEFPDDATNWFFLAQLQDLPFDVNFGDAGTGYAFVNKDGRRGSFLWQCY